jgi:hypothetical protein
MGANYTIRTQLSHRKSFIIHSAWLSIRFSISIKLIGVRESVMGVGGGGGWVQITLYEVFFIVGGLCTLKRTPICIWYQIV